MRRMCASYALHVRRHGKGARSLTISQSGETSESDQRVLAQASEKNHIRLKSYYARANEEDTPANAVAFATRLSIGQAADQHFP